MKQMYDFYKKYYKRPEDRERLKHPKKTNAYDEFIRIIIKRGLYIKNG